MVNFLRVPQEGLVYLIPCGNRYVLSQVGRGSDLGVFKKMYNSKQGFVVGDLMHPPVFRVHFATQSPRANQWVLLGLYPLMGSMGEPSPYLYRPVGEGRCFIVEHGKDDREIDCERVGDLECLATWSHEHIIKRINSMDEFL
jgi:hypothetical protein